jgi:carbohydrate-selective porin OprB
MDEDLILVLGKQDANVYFSRNRFGGSFIFPAFTLIQTIPMPTFPAYALGATLLVKPVRDLYLGMGAYGGTPETGGLGFNAFNGKGGVFSILESTWKPNPGFLVEGHSGTMI